MQEAFARARRRAGSAQWIDTCPNQLYSALTFQGGAAWRKRLLDDLGDQGPVTRLIDKRSDEELARLMANLGGHDLPSLLEAFEAIDHDRPTVFIAYTIKGFGLPLAGHKDNHAGLLTPTQMEGYRASREGARRATNGTSSRGCRSLPDANCERFLDAVPFNAPRARAGYEAPQIAVPDDAGDAEAAGDVDAAGLRADPQRARPLRASRSPTASSRRRPTSPSRPISAPGSTGAGSSPARR